MKALTLRNIPAEVAIALEREADAQGTSLSKTVIRMLEQAFGLAGQRTGKKSYHDLDTFIGSWSEEEAREFDAALAQQRQVDKELWE